MSNLTIGAFIWPGQSAAAAQSRQNLPGNLLASATSDSGSTTSAVSAALAPSAASATGTDDAVEKFTNYMKETPAQRIQDAWLQQHGITRQQFDAMSPADKQKIIDAMKSDLETKIKQKMEAASKPSVNIVV